MRRFFRWLGSMFEASTRAAEGDLRPLDDLTRELPAIRPDERCEFVNDGERCNGFTRYEDDHAWGYHRSDCPGLDDMRAYTAARRRAA